MTLEKDNIKQSVGRKRDPNLNVLFLEAALNILAERDYDAMTMDMIAGATGSSKATLYRRWPSKAELVKDALIWMSNGSVELGSTPDTGSLRGDLLAVLKPYAADYAEWKLRILTSLGTFFAQHEALAKEVTEGIFTPWTNLNRALMSRAKERGEISPHADIDMACEVIAAMTSYYSMTQKKVFVKEDYEALLDKVLLPALTKA